MSGFFEELGKELLHENITKSPQSGRVLEERKDSGKNVTLSLHKPDSDSNRSSSSENNPMADFFGFVDMDEDCPDFDLFDERINEEEEEVGDPIPIYSFSNIATLQESLNTRNEESKTLKTETVTKTEQQTTKKELKKEVKTPKETKPETKGTETRMDYDLICTGSLTVNFDITGDICTTDTLTVNGSVIGNVKADTLILNGSIDGDIDCNLFSPSKTAKFNGKIKTNGFDIRN